MATKTKKAPAASAFTPVQGDKMLIEKAQVEFDTFFRGMTPEQQVGGKTVLDWMTGTLINIKDEDGHGSGYRAFAKFWRQYGKSFTNVTL